MKKNIFNYPVFPGKYIHDMPEDHPVHLPIEKGVHVTFTNDLTLIAIDTQKVDLSTISKSYCTLSEDKFADIMMMLMAIACGLKPDEITDEVMGDFMMYICSTSMESCMKNVRANLMKESVTVNGVGFFVD